MQPNHVVAIDHLYYLQFSVLVLLVLEDIFHGHYLSCAAIPHLCYYEFYFVNFTEGATPQYV